LDRVIERVSFPDAVLRPAIRGAIAARILRERMAADADPVGTFAQARSTGAIAIGTEAANEQHYEVTPSLYELVLGPRLKYSSCLFETSGSTLAQAEDAMLELTCQRAGVVDGERILELGCGWGSLTLWLAERYPNAQVTAVSNSAPQREFILSRAPGNVEVITADVSTLDLGRRFDRVISVEMFEHVRNHAELLARIREHMTDDAKLFVHVFAHHARGYEFEDTWMTRRFFSGGVMPVHGWLGRVEAPLAVEQDWWLEGTHYARTGRAWLDNIDARRAEVLTVLAGAYGPADAPKRLRDWRLFFLACEEIFAFRGGREYGVSHALLHAR
jgi:cyclopropane-fatty-acyl-phospholipid synthase